MILRFILSVISFTVWHYGNVYLNAYATVQAGQVAVDQFSNSNSAYVNSMVWMDFFKNLSKGQTSLILLGVIMYIWYKPIKSLIEKSKNSVLSILGLMVCLTAFAPNDAQAYYSRQDWAEVYNVLPNHSAFMIPATGDTKDSQKQFESESFLNEKKVGAKRIQIPHVVLKNTGVVDYYVPGAILVVLDRTPYVVTWTKASTPESPANQEMCVESQDSVEVCFDTSIGANVTEEDAAKYLYWFGTEPVLAGNDDEKKFPSSLNGKSLQNVMNTRVFSRIHAAYFEEFSKYAFADMMKHKSEILDKVEKDMIQEYKKMGITIEYVGIASQFRYSREIQAGIDSVISADYNQRAAVSKLEIAKVARYEAETQIMLNQSTPYTKWDGKSFPNVPQFWVSSESVLAWVKSLWAKP